MHRAQQLPRSFTLRGPASAVIEIPDGTQLGLGRDPAYCPVAEVFAAMPEVSRQHALVTNEGGRLVIVDAGSTNGTWLANGTWTKGRQITAGEKVALVPGDTISLGGDPEALFVVS